MAGSAGAVDRRSVRVAASVELLILANNPHGGEHLKDLLVGQILWVSPNSLIPIAILYGRCSRSVVGMRARLGNRFLRPVRAGDDASVQLVGVYLVFASLIIPAINVGGSRKAGITC